MSKNQGRRRRLVGWLAPLLAVLGVGCSRAKLDWAEVEQRIAREAPGVPTIGSADLARRLAAGEDFLLLDVREEQEFAVSHLPGAIRVTDLATAQQLAAQRRVPIVTYCSVGVRSARLARDLREAGVLDVANLQGSIFRWANERRDLVSTDGPTRLVHPFDDRWGTLLDPASRAPLEGP